MSTAWNLTREQIGRRVLQKVGNLARGATPRADDLQICYDALDGILKELPIYGYVWPQVAPAQAVVTLVAATPTASLPVDYHGSPILTYFDASGNELPLPLLTLSQWTEIVRKTDPAAYPQFGYIGPDNTLHVWPVQTANVSARLSYQKILPDTSPTAVSGIDQTMVNGLVYGVAFAVSDEFPCEADKVARWGAMWAERRALGIMARGTPLPDCISTQD